MLEAFLILFFIIPMWNVQNPMRLAINWKLIWKLNIALVMAPTWEVTQERNKMKNPQRGILIKVDYSHSMPRRPRSNGIWYFTKHKVHNRLPSHHESASWFSCLRDHPNEYHTRHIEPTQLELKLDVFWRCLRCDLTFFV